MSERFHGRLYTIAVPSREIPGPVVLRDYQEKGVSAIRREFLNGASHVLYVLPTGAGKTVVVGYVVRGHVAPGGRVLIVVHRTELIKQIVAALKRLRVVYGVIAPGFAESGPAVQIAMIQTLAHRLDRWAG